MFSFLDPALHSETTTIRVLLVTLTLEVHCSTIPLDMLSKSESIDFWSYEEIS